MKRADITDIQVCEACRDCHNLPGCPFANALLAERTGAPIKVVDAAMERAMSRGLLDCGVSLRTAWLTPAGQHLLDEVHA